MIIVAITGPSQADARRQMRASTPFADLFELRLDLLAGVNDGRLIRGALKPIIATCRPVREGGLFRGSEKTRLRRLVDAVRSGARFVDIEHDAWDAFQAALHGSGVSPRMIVSRHLLGGPLPVGDREYAQLHATGAEVVKLAYDAGDAWQIAAAVRFLVRARADRRKAIAIAMGEAGEATRILYRHFGGWATYAGTEDGKASAPGQLPASTMKRVFRSHRLTPHTRVFGLLGNPVRQSKGIYIHNPVYRKQGVDAVYVRFPISDLRRFMRTVGPLLSGCSVTLPHKQKMMQFLSSADPTVGAIGAVNTVVRRRRGWHGANTDAGAALDAIENQLRVRGRTILILGAGGASRAIAVEARRRGAMVTVAGRTPAKTRSLARSTGVSWVPWRDRATVPCDILVNTTPLGMWPDTEAAPMDAIPPGTRVVFDAIYNPPMTRLLRTAVAAGTAVVTGMEMYIRQGVEQIGLFTGTRPDPKELRRLFLRRI